MAFPTIVNCRLCGLTQIVRCIELAMRYCPRCGSPMSASVDHPFNSKLALAFVAGPSLAHAQIFAVLGPFNGPNGAASLGSLVLDSAGLSAVAFQQPRSAIQELFDTMLASGHFFRF